MIRPLQIVLVLRIAKEKIIYKVNNRIMQAFHHLFVYPKHFFIFKIIFVTIVTKINNALSVSIFTH